MFIVDQKVMPLLGLNSLQGMGIVKVSMVSGVDNPVNNVVQPQSKRKQRLRMSQRVLDLETK